jgi:hypothetical protein
MQLLGTAAAAAELATQYISSFQDSRKVATPPSPLMSLVQLLVVLLWMLLLLPCEHHTRSSLAEHNVIHSDISAAAAP